MVAEALDSTWHVTVRFILSALAVYRLSILIAREDGPWGVLRRFRSSAKATMVGHLAACVNCLSVWISLPLAAFVGDSWIEVAVAWWALSGAAVLMDRATRDLFEVENKEPSS